MLKILTVHYCALPRAARLFVIKIFYSEKIVKNLEKGKRKLQAQNFTIFLTVFIQIHKQNLYN